jgi:hypothetical protein
MDSPEHDWHAAFARAREESDADVRAEALDVFVAEAGRGRLVDRLGRGRLRLRSGVTVTGRLTGATQVADHVDLVDDAGRTCQIATRAVVTIAGSRAALRPEPAPELRSVSSWLREVWTLGAPLSVLDVTGDWHHGHVIAVASDHVDLDVDGSVLTVPYAAVDAWRV